MKKDRIRVIFAHDHRFKEDSQGKLYSGNDFSKSIWDRYKYIGDEIRVIARCENTEDEGLKGYSEFNEENVSLRKLENLNNPKVLITSLNKSKKIIRQEVSECDAVICRLPSTIGNMVYTEAKKQNKPCLVEVVGCPWDAFWNYGTLVGKILAPIYVYFTKKKVLDSEYVIYVTNEFLQKRYPNKNNNIGCSDVSIEIEEETFLQKKLQKKYGNGVTIGLIGSLDVGYKGQDTALKALKILKGKGLDVKLRFLGPGSITKWEKMSEEMGIREFTFFDGVRKSGKGVLEWLDEVDIYIQPSTTEGLSRAAIEAQSRGCALIVTDCGEMKELIDNEFVINKNDYRSLAGKIENLVKKKIKMEIKVNYERAKKYDINVLEKKRRAFYNMFKEEIKI